MEYAEIYMKLTRSGSDVVQGDTLATGFEGQIELSEWSWGIELDSSSDMAESRKGRRSEPKAFAFSKPVDRSSTALMAGLKNGETFDEAVITMVDRTRRQTMVRVTLRKVRVMSYDLDVETGDGEVELEEDWEAVYNEIQIDHKGMSDAGKAVGKSAVGAVRSFRLNCPGAALPRPTRSTREDDEMAELRTLNSKVEDLTEMQEELGDMRELMTEFEKLRKQVGLMSNELKALIKSSGGKPPGR